MKLKQEMASVESQTSMECEDCGYPSEDLEDIGEHLYENIPESIICYLCGWKLKSKRYLMLHRKERHKQNVRMCLYFAQGICEFSDEDCWYQHETKESPLDQALKEFKCSLCGHTFNIKSDFMKHRKREHPQNISICKTYNNGSCKFGNEKCWYKHIDKQSEMEEIIDDSPEIITRIFDMMEKFAERFELIENQL
jgi:rubredoxin